MTPDTSSSPPLLEMRGIGKSFPGVRVLRGVDLTLHAGEVLALLGENGAGKSTLIKMLAGIHRPDEGRILIAGDPVELPSPNAALAAGIGVIHQEFQLVPALTPWRTSSWDASGPAGWSIGTPSGSGPDSCSPSWGRTFRSTPPAASCRSPSSSWSRLPRPSPKRCGCW
ncbi:MAG: ATP-binding cassette domain-containing protein [Planctomycetaceae bacterium]